LNRLIVLFAVLLLSIQTSAGPTPARHSYQNQLELTEQACAAYKKADAEMNSIYRKILNENRKDRLFVQKMRAAQRAWLMFRDAHLESIFPATDKRTAYGSVQPMCHCMELEKITDERAKDLKQWVDGVEEGDVCAGSR
jgi:uncharacterized protein YecT (DUF1311 family)